MYEIAVMSGNSPSIRSQFYSYVLILIIVFARYHTREFMVPSCRQSLKLIDFEDTMQNYEFVKKVNLLPHSLIYQELP